MSYEISHLYEFDSFHLDPVEHQLLRDGVSVPLTPKVFDTLRVLVERSGHLVEKEELMNLVWADAFVEEANLARCVHTLRKALGEEQGGKRYIETVPKRGYRFVADVRVIENSSTNVKLSGEAEEERQKRSPAMIEAVQPATPPGNDASANDSAPASRVRVVPTPALAGPPRRLRTSMFIVPLALVVAAIGAYLSATTSRQTIIDKTPITSIAVLPFVNVSADPETEYLSDGISEGLINSLSQLPGLKVIARSSSFKYKGKAADPQEVSRLLGVAAIVTGRVLQRDGQLQISVELMDAREGTQVWGNQYNRRRADLLAAQAELSGEIARQLRLKLTPVNQQQLTKRETVNAEAYELVLRGRAQREKGSPENLKRAVELFKSAISIDPSYALPHAELSIIYGLLTSSNLLNPKEYRPQAQAEARQALALDANLADAHYAMANVEMDIWNWPAAAAAFDRALELNPSLARARWRHALYLSIMGQHDQAIAEIERARELNPLSPRFKAYVSIMLLNAHRIDEGIKVLQNTLALDPNSREALTGLGYAYLAKGMYAEAISYYQKAIKLGYTGTSTQIYLGAAYARGGERNKALAILKRLQTSKEYVSPGELTVLYVALGQREEAFASLERAYAERDVQLGGLGHEPGFDPLRSDPRFINLMQRVGLPL
jgi:TolB-like protein/DNA-binding winged helix-turn-helix (wHTH) protein/Tfp pilus assembly protein PilF